MKRFLNAGARAATRTSRPRKSSLSIRATVADRKARLYVQDAANATQPTTNLAGTL